MARIMKWTALLMSILSALLIFLTLRFPDQYWEAAAITAGTITYHLVMRLLVGWAINRCMHNQANPSRKHYQVSDRELRFYDWLGIRRWKRSLPTYDPSLFDRHIHSWHEIAMAMCQAQVVHEVIAVLSLLPILCGFLFGAWAVFIITSVLSSCMDLTFVMLQRYNRPRILKLDQMLQQRHRETDKPDADV